MATVATIGVYGFTGASFGATLTEAGVTLLLDVRQRRGVRGSEYAWANSVRLQAALAQAGIGYHHVRALAPTTDLRHLQYQADAVERVGKRNRVRLAHEYVQRYVDEILDRCDLAPLADEISRAGVAALMCVERDAAACHRSLIAARLHACFGMEVVHLGGSAAPA
jgi:uncharacterized protein (DUF488 family)